MIKKFWQVSWDQWLHRNPKLHDKDQGLIAQQINDEIHTEFALGFDGFPRDLCSTHTPVII